MTAPSTLVHQLEQRANVEPDQPALLDRIDGRWRALTWSQYAEQSREIAAGLIAMGVKPGQSVVLMGPNCRDWSVAQLGIWSAGATACPIYATSTDEQTAYIIGNADAVAAIVFDADAAEKLGHLRDSRGLPLDLIAKNGAPSATSLDDLRAKGRDYGLGHVDERMAELDSSTLALLIYTSGTTGKPKGVQLDHGNMLAVMKGVTQINPVIREEEYILISYLPLSHVAEQMFTIMLHLELGGRVYFCPELSLMKEYLPEVRPTVFVGVPRVWEKFQAALEIRLAEATGLRKGLAQWALRCELDGQRRDMKRGSQSSSLRRKLARRLVIDKIHRRLGLDRLKFGCAGAAPTSTRTLEFFASLGIVIHEGFGMTETAGGITANPYLQPKFGTVGKAIPGVEVRIADDGEILLRGRAMTRGYYKLEAETRELIDEEGWLHTGDVGELDREGFLRITGRKNEILITAGGKNVAPVEIEARLDAIEGVAQSVVMGDRASYLVALLVLDPEAVPKLAARLELDSERVQDVARNPRFVKYLQEGIDRANEGLARYQTVKKFHVLADEFSVEGGELTPSLKLRRTKIAEKYGTQVTALYEAPAVEQSRAG